jgi:hypothetical protein
MIKVTMKHANDIDPKSKAIVDNEPFIIAQGFAGNLRAIQSEPDIHRAQKARDNLAEHKQRCGGNPNEVRIFRTQDIIWDNPRRNKK